MTPVSPQVIFVALCVSMQGLLRGQLMVYISTNGKWARQGIVPGTKGQKRFNGMQWYTDLLALCKYTPEQVQAFLHPLSKKNVQHPVLLVALEARPV
jgi:hypothetical protein